MTWTGAVLAVIGAGSFKAIEAVGKIDAERGSLLVLAAITAFCLLAVGVGVLAMGERTWQYAKCFGLATRCERWLNLGNAPSGPLPYMGDKAKVVEKLWGWGGQPCWAQSMGFAFWKAPNHCRALLLWGAAISCGTSLVAPVTAAQAITHLEGFVARLAFLGLAALPWAVLWGLLASGAGQLQSRL